MKKLLTIITLLTLILSNSVASAEAKKRKTSTYKKSSYTQSITQPKPAPKATPKPTTKPKAETKQKVETKPKSVNQTSNAPDTNQRTEYIDNSPSALETFMTGAAGGIAGGMIYDALSNDTMPTQAEDNVTAPEPIVEEVIDTSDTPIATEPDTERPLGFWARAFLHLFE